MPGKRKTNWAEQGQAQLKLGLDFTLSFCIIGWIYLVLLDLIE